MLLTELGYCDAQCARDLKYVGTEVRCDTIGRISA